MDLSPNLSAHEASQALRQARADAARLYRAQFARTGGPILVLWGAVWAVNFLLTYFIPYRAGTAWAVGNTLGIAGTYAIMWRCRYQPVRDTDRTLGWRIGGLWAAIGLFVFACLAVASPVDARQVGTLICLSMMLAWVIMGLWLEMYALLTLGLLVSGLTLVGYFLLGRYFPLWMAATAGGAMIGGGLYTMFRWR